MFPKCKTLSAISRILDALHFLKNCSGVTFSRSMYTPTLTHQQRG